MIRSIPNQPISFEPPLMQVNCPEQPIPVLIAADDTLYLQVEQGRCPDAEAFIANPDFSDPYDEWDLLSPGGWTFSPGLACGFTGFAGGGISYGSWSPTPGAIYEIEVDVESISGAGFNMSIGGQLFTITEAGLFRATFFAVNADLLAIFLADSTSAGCIRSVQVYEGNALVRVDLVDCETGDTIEDFEVDRFPQYFSYLGTVLRVAIPLAFVDLGGPRTFRVRVSDGCAYGESMESTTVLCVPSDCLRTVLLRVCNDTAKMGFAPGVFELRARASIYRPRWEFEVRDQRNSNGRTVRTYADRRTVVALGIEAQAATTHEFLSMLPMFDHLYIDGREWMAEAGEYQPEYADSLVGNGAALLELRPKQELVRNVLCGPEGPGCSGDVQCGVPVFDILAEDDFTIGITLFDTPGWTWATSFRYGVNISDPDISVPITGVPFGITLGPFQPGDIVRFAFEDANGCEFYPPQVVLPDNEPVGEDE